MDTTNGANQNKTSKCTVQKNPVKKKKNVLKRKHKFLFYKSSVRETSEQVLLKTKDYCRITARQKCLSEIY